MVWSFFVGSILKPLVFGSHADSPVLLGGTSASICWPPWMQAGTWDTSLMRSTRKFAIASSSQHLKVNSCASALVATVILEFLICQCSHYTIDQHANTSCLLRSQDSRQFGEDTWWDVITFKRADLSKWLELFEHGVYTKSAPFNHHTFFDKTAIQFSQVSFSFRSTHITFLLVSCYTINDIYIYISMYIHYIHNICI